MRGPPLIGLHTRQKVVAKKASKKVPVPEAVISAVQERVNNLPK